MKPQREAPSTAQLVSGAVAVLEKVPVAAFSLADLLLSHCAQKPEREEAVMGCLLDRLAPDGESSAAEPAEGTLLATAHLLAVLCDASAAMRIAGVRQGRLPVTVLYNKHVKTTHTTWDTAIWSCGWGMHRMQHLAQDLLSQHHLQVWCRRHWISWKRG